ncbi:MAG: hypothetical protein ACHQNV_06700 [Vicinamibacteria bacterium]
MLLAILAVAAAATAPRPFADERLLLDRRLETLRRILPDAPNGAADTALIKEMADGAKLSGAEALARPPVEATTTRADVIVDLTAVGRYADVDRFFRQVSLSVRPIDVESLSIDSTPERVVKLTAVFRFPYRPLKAPLPAPPEGTRARTAGSTRAQADAYSRDVALALAKSDAIASLRRTRRNPRLFLSELAAIVRDRPVVVSHASVGDDFAVRGLTVGEGPVRALETRFERGFLRVADFVMARQGACLRFEVRGKSPVVGPDAELPLPTEDPFDQDEAPCRIDRDAVRTVVIKGPATKAPGQGPLSLRLRDLDLTDVFSVLHGLTGQGFLVDGDVAGRVSVELNRVTLEEALAAIAKSSDLRVSDPGLVRRVSLLRNAPPPDPKRAAAGAKAKPSPAPAEAPPAGPPATFTLKRADIRDVLAVMTDADPSLAALGPQGFLGRVSLWAKDVPLFTLRSAILAAAGLTERVEEDHRFLERRPGNDDTLVPVARAVPDPQLVLRAQDLTVQEFDLAGLASASDAWTAFAYTPTGALHAYRPGDRLADGILRDVQSTDVGLDTEEGPLRLGLGALP